MPENQLQVNITTEQEIAEMLDKLCAIDVRTRSLMVTWLIRQEYARRFSQPSLMTVEEATGE